MKDDLYLARDAASMRRSSLLSVRDVARTLGVTPKAVGVLIRRRELVAVKIDGRLVVPSGAVRSFLAEGEARRAG